MANYYGTGRSNYVRVSDLEKFKQICIKYGLTFIQNKEGLVGFTCEEMEDGDVPAFIYDEETEDDISVDPLKEMSELLLDNEVLVHQTIGNEKMRYVSGYSIAINNKGKFVSIGLDDIYKKAKKLGKNITQAQY